MRYLFVIQQYLPRIGGAEIVLERQMLALQAEGHTVEMVTLRLEHSWPQHEVRNGIPITRIGGVFWRGKLRLKSALMLVVLARLTLTLWPRVGRADVVHCSMIGPLSALGALIAHRRGRPVVLMIHMVVPVPVSPGPQRLMAGTLDPALPCLQVPPHAQAVGDFAVLQRDYPWLRRWASRHLQADHVHVVALTDGMRDYLISQGFAPDHISVIPNTVPSAAFDIMRQVSTPPMVLCVARHSYEKGIDILLHAWHTVAAQCPDARLILIGDGAIHAQLREIAERLGIAASVEFRGGTPDVRSALAVVTCCVQPSRWEGFGVALIEAMAAGVPCVTTPVGVVNELMHDGAAQGFLVVDTPEAMATAILQLSNDPALARTIGMAGQQIVRDRFTQSTATEQLLALSSAVHGRA